MFIAVVSPLQLTTGNRTTALRIVAILNELGHKTIVVDAFNARSFRFLASPDAFVCIHAFRSAIPLLAVHERTPVVLVMGGTDANDTLVADDRAPGVGDANCNGNDNDNDDDDNESVVDVACDTPAIENRRRRRRHRHRQTRCCRLTRKGEELRHVLQKSCAVVCFSTPLCDVVRSVLAVGPSTSRIGGDVAMASTSAHGTQKGANSDVSSSIATTTTTTITTVTAPPAFSAPLPPVFEIPQGVDLHVSSVSPTPFVYVRGRTCMRLASSGCFCVWAGWYSSVSSVVLAACGGTTGCRVVRSRWVRGMESPLLTDMCCVATLPSACVVGDVVVACVRGGRPVLVRWRRWLGFQTLSRARK